MMCCYDGGGLMATETFAITDRIENKFEVQVEHQYGINQGRERIIAVKVESSIEKSLI